MPERNVFFLIEIIRALADNAGELHRIGDGELPERVLTAGIERIVERRIERLPALYHPLLEFAATLGRKLDLPALEAAFPKLALRSVLIECANAAVLESMGSEWRFAHDKLRELILHRLSPPRQKELHKWVAETLEGVYTGLRRDALNATLAQHFQQAEVYDKALSYYVRAGDNAVKLALLEEARAHYAAAIAMLERLESTPARRRIKFDVLVKQVQSGLTHDATEAQLQRLDEARSLLPELGSGESGSPAERLVLARLDYLYGRVLHYSGQPREAIRYFRRVLPVARECGDQELLITPSYVIGLALCLQGQFGKARELLGTASEPLVRQLGPGIDAIRCVMYHCIALMAAGEREQAQPLVRRARAWAEGSPQPLYLATFLVTELAMVHMSADWPGTIEVADRVQEIAKKANEMLFMYCSLDFKAWAQSQLGQHAEAAENRARALEIRRPLGGGIISDWFEAGESEILLVAGRTEEALRQAQKVAASSRAAELVYSQAVSERVWGCALSRLGEDLDEAERHFAASLYLCQKSEQRINAAKTEMWWGRICKERGDAQAAQQHFARALEQIGTRDYAYVIGEIKRAMMES